VKKEGGSVLPARRIPTHLVSRLRIGTLSAEAQILPQRRRLRWRKDLEQRMGWLYLTKEVVRHGDETICV